MAYSAPDVAFSRPLILGDADHEPVRRPSLFGKNRSAVNRQRFLRRFKGQIRKAVAHAVSGRKVADLERGKDLHPVEGSDRADLSPRAGGRRSIV